MPLSTQHQKFFYSLFSNPNSPQPDLYLDQVANKQTTNKYRSIKLRYSVPSLEDTSAFCDLKDFALDLTLDDAVCLEEESVFIGDQLQYERWYYSEGLDTTNTVVEQRYTDALGNEVVDTTPSTDGLEFTDPITLDSPHIDLSWSEVVLSDVEWEREVFYSPTTSNWQIEAGDYSGSFQFNYLPVARGVVGFSLNEEVLSTYIVPGVEDGYLPCTSVSDLSPTATLETISNGLLLALVEEDIEYIVSVLNALCSISRREGLIIQSLDSYVFNPDVYPGFYSSYHRLSLLPADESKSTYGNAILGAAIVECLKFLKDRPYATQVSLSGSQVDFEGQILALLKSIGYFLAGAVDFSCFCLPGVIDSQQIPAEGYSYLATVAAPIFLAGLLSLEYDYNLHYAAARLFNAVIQLPLDPNKIPTQTFYDDTDKAVCLINRARFAKAFGRTNELSELLTLFQELTTAQPQSNLLVQLQYLNLLAEPTDNDYNYVVELLLENEDWFDADDIFDPVEYFAENELRRSQLSSLGLELYGLALLKNKSVWSPTNYNLYAEEADAYSQYLRQWFSYSLPTGYYWFNPDLALLDQTAIGALAAASSSVAFGYGLKVSIYESGKQLTTAQGSALQYWSELMLEAKPLLNTDRYWGGWLNSFLTLRRNIPSQLDEFLLTLGFKPIELSLPGVNVSSSLAEALPLGYYLQPYASDTIGEISLTAYPFVEKFDARVAFVRFEPEGAGQKFEEQFFDPNKPTLDTVRYLANTESYELLNSSKALEQLTDLDQVNYTNRTLAGTPQHLRASHLYPLDSLHIDQGVNDLSYFVEPLFTGTVKLRVLGNAGPALSLLIRSAPIGTKFEVQSFTPAQV